MDKVKNDDRDNYQGGDSTQDRRQTIVPVSNNTMYILAVLLWRR